MDDLMSPDKLNDLYGLFAPPLIGAAPYDIPTVELGHHRDQCSFHAFIDRRELRAPAPALLATIVRGADMGGPDLMRQPRHGLVMYDALYCRCLSLQGETHNGTPTIPARIGSRA